MAGESTYKIVELVGTSKTSWEEAASAAVKSASESLKDLRIAEVVKMDMTIEKGKVALFRVRITLSFKYQG
jgi:dodecin